MPGLVHGDGLGSPMLAVEMDQQLLVIPRGLSHNGNDAPFFFVRFLEVVNRERLGWNEIVPLAAGLQIAHGA